VPIRGILRRHVMWHCGASGRSRDGRLPANRMASQIDTLTPHSPSRRSCDSLLSGLGFLAVDAFLDNVRKNDLPGCGIDLQMVVFHVSQFLRITIHKVEIRVDEAPARFRYFPWSILIEGLTLKVVQRVGAGQRSRIWSTQSVFGFRSGSFSERSRYPTNRQPSKYEANAWVSPR
jgi:hypothetical protein